MQTRSREGRSERRPGNGRSHNKPPSGDSLREFVLHSLSKRGARPAYETFPSGTSSPAGRYRKERLNYGPCSVSQPIPSLPPPTSSSQVSSEPLTSRWPCRLAPRSPPAEGLSWNSPGAEALSAGRSHIGDLSAIADCLPDSPSSRQSASLPN